MTTETPAPAEALSPAPWVIVALYPDGRVCAASMLGYANEAEFRAECKGLDILIVPGPIALGEPLTAEQENAAVTDRDAALHERAALRARAEAAEAEVKRLREALRAAQVGIVDFRMDHPHVLAVDGLDRAENAITAALAGSPS